MKNIILSLTESPYEVRYIKRFYEKSKEMGIDSSIYFYTYSNLLSEFIPPQRIILDQLLEDYLKIKEHRIYENFFNYANKIGANIIIPRVVFPEYLYSTLISIENCPNISLSGYAFELFIRSKSRANIVKKILEIDKVSGLLLHTIGGKSAEWPPDLYFTEENLKKIKLHSEPFFDKPEKLVGQSLYLKDKLSIKKNKKLVLFFGSMYPWKGPDTLLNSLKYLNDDFHLIFAGNTLTYNGDLNVFKHPQITLLDKPDDALMYELYKSADIVACPYGPSYAYGTSSVCMNAILASKPVI